MRIFAVLLLVSLLTASVDAQSGRRGGRGRSTGRAPSRSYQSAPAQQNNQAQNAGAVSADDGTVTNESGPADGVVVDGSAPVIVNSTGACCTRTHRTHHRHRSRGHSRRCRRCRR